MRLEVAIVGAGMGGLAAAAALRSMGAEVRVYEQAGRFARIGAGIQMLPNSMKVLRGIGVATYIEACGNNGPDAANLRLESHGTLTVSSTSPKGGGRTMCPVLAQSVRCNRYWRCGTGLVITWADWSTNGKMKSPGPKRSQAAVIAGSST